MPAFHCAHTNAICNIFEMIVSVRQCFTNKVSCPSPCRTFHGIIPHPAYVLGQYLMGFAVFLLLNHCLLKMIGSNFASALLRTDDGKKHCGKTYFKHGMIREIGAMA